MGAQRAHQATQENKANRGNTSKLREHQFNNVCAANAHNTTKQTNPVQVAHVTERTDEDITDACFVAICVSNSVPRQ